MALPFRMLQAGFGLADRLPAGLHPRLAAGRLIAGARAAPDAAAREGLAVLLESLAADTALSYFGQLSTVWDFRRLLGNARAVDEIHREDRGVAEAVVAAPVFILGLPRSGTTFLHALLAEDEGGSGAAQLADDLSGAAAAGGFSLAGIKGPGWWTVS